MVKRWACAFEARKKHEHGLISSNFCRTVTHSFSTHIEISTNATAMYKCAEIRSGKFIDNSNQIKPNKNKINIYKYGMDGKVMKLCMCISLSILLMLTRSCGKWKGLTENEKQQEKTRIYRQASNALQHILIYLNDIICIYCMNRRFFCFASVLFLLLFLFGINNALFYAWLCVILFKTNSFFVCGSIQCFFFSLFGWNSLWKYWTDVI